MSHEIDFSNGRANAAYAISGGKAWHGLGQMLDSSASIHDWVVQAGLDWRAQKVQAGFALDQFNPNTGATETVWKEWADQYAIVRDDTMQPLGQFTKRYKIHQPEEIMGMFRDFVTIDERFAMESAGSLKGGKVIWALAKYQDDLEVMNEKHCAYLLCTTSFDGSLATTAQGTMIRVECNNKLMQSLYSPNSTTVKIRHNAHFDQKAQAKAIDDLTSVIGGFSQYKAMGEALAGVRMSHNTTEAFFKDLLGIGDDTNQRTLNQFEQLMESLELTVKEGTERGNAWTAFNSVTRFTDHMRTTRRTDNMSEFESRTFSTLFGSSADLKAKALEMLLPSDFDLMAA